ncbi:MAG: energy-coupling factor transporter transmembrane protein EcfT [Oscillospiraceae bacterium]|jgi:energy-coupling factor transport system permease protein|nr:energy-coupling factor transporter transmembrane protein EcfT [Oscillospiraceae bacterium]
MLRNVTLGQYFPGNTIVHRLDPRIKLILTIVYFTALFLAKGFPSYILMLVVLLTCLFLSKTKPKTALSGLRPIIFIILFTVILSSFFTKGTAIVEFWGIAITEEGLLNALFMASRLIMLIVGTFLLTYTTSPIALTDGLELMLNPLKKIRLPIHELAMMMSLALRFIPALIEETDKIISAQKARGADFETGGLIKRAKAILPIIIPLFISAFRRSDELAIAMESRCYHGGEGRTRMKTLKAAGRDVIALICGAIVLAAVIIVRS